LIFSAVSFGGRNEVQQVRWKAYWSVQFKGGSSTLVAQAGDVSDKVALLVFG